VRGKVEQKAEKCSGEDET